MANRRRFSERTKQSRPPCVAEGILYRSGRFGDDRDHRYALYDSGKRCETRAQKRALLAARRIHRLGEKIY